MPQDTNSVGIAVIGSGRMGSIRAHLAGTDPRVDFLAVTDIEADKAEALAKLTDANVHGTDNLAAIEDERVDAVIVSTFEGEHTDAVCAALELGKSVLVEKPIALSLAEADRIVEISKRSRGDLYVGYTQRLRRRFVAVKEHITQGRLGDISMLQMHAYTNRSLARQIYLRSPEATLISDGTTYLVDMALWFLAPRRPVRLYAHGGGEVFDQHPLGLGDYGWAILTFDDGASVNLGVSGILPESWPAYVASLGVELFGTEGSLLIDDTHRDVMLATDDPVPSPYAPDSLFSVALLGSAMPGDWALGDFYGPMRDETRLWLEHVTTGREIPLCDASQGRDVLALTLAMERSAVAGGCVIDDPLKSVA